MANECYMHGGDGDPEDCPYCIAAAQPCWVTKKGKAYHVRPDCEFLRKGQAKADQKGFMTEPPMRKTVGNVRGRPYEPCPLCARSACAACMLGRHQSCSPAASQLARCVCADAGHKTS
jgi:hypothetical protein